LEDDLRGIDKKPLPYLLATMNLLLHGVDRPHLVRDNALAHTLADHRRDRVEVIATKPPFGGEEEDTIRSNFPIAMRTSKTEWLFMQVVIERLRTGGRCGIVVPNNMLVDAVGTPIRQRLLEICNLHTVVRMPDGVFAPYTLIRTNLLFFEKTGSTRFTWFYELPPPEGRRNYTKTHSLRHEEFSDLKSWWGGRPRRDRMEGRRAWRVPIGDVIDRSYDLDLKNPNRENALADRRPSELVAELISAEREILALLEQVSVEVKDEP
jgi:type I restriction enzyme M protein